MTSTIPFTGELSLFPTCQTIFHSNSIDANIALATEMRQHTAIVHRHVPVPLTFIRNSQHLHLTSERNGASTAKLFCHFECWKCLKPQDSTKGELNVDLCSYRPPISFLIGVCDSVRDVSESHLSHVLNLIFDYEVDTSKLAL